MAFEADFLTSMVQTVTIKPLTVRDGYGAPTFAVQVQVPGHVTYVTKAIRKNIEEHVYWTAIVQIPPPGYVTPAGVTVPRVKQGDEIVLPDDGVTRHTLSAVTVTDEDGDHHQTLNLT